MKRLLFLLLSFFAAYPLAAQQVVERQQKLAAGQRVFLNLRPADHIRVRAGAPGQMSFKATVSINQNKLNDAFVLDLSRSGEELQVSTDLDKEKLRAATPGDGDCPAGQGSYWGESWTSDGDGTHHRQHGVCVAIDYDVALPAGTELRISTISGAISLVGLTGVIQARSISGDVDLSWPSAQSADLALKTISGEVYADPAVALLNQRERPASIGYEVRGTWRGGGGPAVRLESVSGNVFFRQQR